MAARATEGRITSAALLMTGKMYEAWQLVERFINYGGSTAAGLQTAKSLGVENALTKAFRQGTARAQQMAEGF
ncbi:MAG: hypothetical protein C0524_06230 [Rhodobacter sp.]|nr:hypothetical protein [Rhodobacter sp.]